MAVRGGRTSGGDATVLKTIAVLPFSSGGDTASDYFAEGITDELHSELARAQGLTVKARSVAKLFKNHSDDLASVATRLGIGTLVVGSVRRAGSRVRITAELMRVSDNSTLWSQKFDGEERSLFVLQDSIARAIAGALQARLAEARGPHVATTGTHNLAAYDLFLRGAFLVEKRDDQSVRRAIALFQRAIDVDTSFARAYAALGSALAVLQNTPADSVSAQALAAVEKAIALDSTLAEAHAARGLALWSFRPYRWKAAESSLRHAIELDPREAMAHKWLGDFLLSVGSVEESVAEQRRATEVEPYLALGWSNLGLSQLVARQFDAAITSLRHALALDASLDWVREYMAIAFLLQGKPDAAMHELAAGATTYPLDSAFHAFVFARAGHRDRAKAIARELEQRARSSPVVSGPAGYTLLGLGDSIRALEWFISAADADAFYPLVLASPEFDPIRSLPRYPELLRKLNLQDQPVAKLKAAGR